MPKQTTYPSQGGNNSGNNSNNQQTPSHQQQQQHHLRFQGPQSAFSSHTSNALHFLQQQFDKPQGSSNQQQQQQPSLFNLLDGSTSTMASDEMAHYYQRLFSGNNNNTNSNNHLLNSLSANNVNTPGSSSSNSNGTNPSAFVSPLPPASTPLADSLSYYLEQLGLPNQNKQTGLLAPSTSSSHLTANASVGMTSTQQISKSASSDKISALLNNINNNITNNNSNLPMTSPTSSSSLSSSSGSNGQHVEETKKKKKKKPIAPESDEDEEMQMEGDESGGLFHPIACVGCRRLHKRCDRKLPACSKCVSRGVNCEYKIPRKKGRTAKPKTSTESDQNNASSLPSWEGVSMNPPSELDKISTNTAPQMPDVDVRKISEMNMCIFDSHTTTPGLKPLHSSTTKLLANILSSETPYGNIAKTPEKHLDKRKVLDLYFNIFGNGMPVIDRKEFEGYLSTKSNNSKDDDDEIITDGNEILPNKKEIHAMFLAIKAICEQRTGLSDLAEETMKKAREALSKFFDEHSNFYVSCCYAFMCIYESGCGRLKTAKYYLQSVNFYLDELTEEEQQNMTVYQKNLKKIRSFCKVCSSNDHDSGVLALLKDWPNVFEKTLGIQIPTEWRTLLEQELTTNNYSTMVKVVETLLHIVRMHLTKTGSERNLKIFDMGSTIVFHGIRLGILSAVNRGKELIEESALKITFATENELFLFVPPPIVAHVAAAAKVHLHIVKSIEAGERQNPEVMMVPTVNYGEEPKVGTVDYYEILAKDLRALNILAKRYKKVSLFHKTLMQEMEEIINRKHLMSALNLFTSHSLNDGGKQPNDLPQFTQNFASGSLPTSSTNSNNNGSTNTTPSSSNSSGMPLPTAQNNRITNPLSGFSSDIFSHYNLAEFSDFQNVKNTKEFFSVIANPKNKTNNNNNPSGTTGNQPQIDPPTINWQDMINGSGLNLGNNLGFGLASPVPNMNSDSSLQNESFFEPFLDNDDMQEIYSFAYDEAIGPFMNNSD